MKSPVVAAMDGGGGDVPTAYQCTRHPPRTKAIVRLVKYHSTGPSDSSHYTPSTQLKEPRASP
jgi:hypothetical protein